MRKRIMATLLVLAVCAASLPGFSEEKKGGDKKEAAAPLKIKVGDVAPDFTLLSFDGKDVKPVSLHDYRGKKNVALAFYVFAFTGG